MSIILVIYFNPHSGARIDGIRSSKSLNAAAFEAFSFGVLSIKNAPIAFEAFIELKGARIVRTVVRMTAPTHRVREPLGMRRIPRGDWVAGIPFQSNSDPSNSDASDTAGDKCNRRPSRGTRMKKVRRPDGRGSPQEAWCTV